MKIDQYAEISYPQSHRLSYSGDGLEQVRALASGSSGGSTVTQGLAPFQLSYSCLISRSGIPYLTPNALTMFLLWNLVFMSLMQPYIWLNYVAYYSPSLHITSRMYFWYGFIFIWDGVGMWFSAFGTLYATLFPRLFTLISSHMLANILLHPLTLNAFCFAPPIILMITQLVTSTFSAIAWSNLIYTRSYLLDVLTTVATQWNTRDHQKLDESLVQRAVTIGNLLLKQKELSRVAFQRNAGACQC
ncbi:hypothetical protein FS749_007277 [Ceratobasidium sp. UAMH 11750]|nr:hypothetical protein FS749_007277 [Ceratobasidium sp. UAMH 11750]